MARFIGYLKGNRGQASRLGTKNSGIEARAQGWNIGARIVLKVDSQGRDVLKVYVNGGSSGDRSETLAYSSIE